MAIDKETCAIQTIIDYKHEKELWVYGRIDQTIKDKLLSALKKLYVSGFHSFIVYVGNPTDFWLAETLWEMSETAEYSSITYTLVFITSFVTMQDKWIDNEKYWDEITDKAKEIIWQKSVYPSEMIELVLIDLTGGYGNTSHCKCPLKDPS